MIDKLSDAKCRSATAHTQLDADHALSPSHSPAELPLQFLRFAVHPPGCAGNLFIDAPRSQFPLQRAG
jgi:hypothetical protein